MTRASTRGFDGVVRTITASLLALGLVGALVYWLLTHDDNPPEYLIALASSVCSFYMGGTVAHSLNGNGSKASRPQPPSDRS